MDEPSILADALGIHLRHDPDHDVFVSYEEIDGICAAWHRDSAGGRFLEVYIDVVAGVDFRFHNVDSGYAQVMAVLEERLPGFSRAAAEAVGRFEETFDTPVVWRRA